MSPVSEQKISPLWKTVSAPWALACLAFSLTILSHQVYNEVPLEFAHKLTLYVVSAALCLLTLTEGLNRITNRIRTGSE